MSGGMSEWNDYDGPSAPTRGLGGGRWSGSASNVSSLYGPAAMPTSFAYCRTGFCIAAPVAVPKPSAFARVLAGLACRCQFVRRHRRCAREVQAIGRLLRAATACLSFLGATAVPAATFDLPSATSVTNRVMGATPSGISWEAVATGSALPVRTSGSQNGLPGPVAYYNVDTGQLQIDPKGWNLSQIVFTYTSGTVNVTGLTPGPLVYASGTSPASAVVSDAYGIANQRTLPAGNWVLTTSSPSRVHGTVSLVRSPTLSANYYPGNGAANGGSPYATDPAGKPCVPGWFNQPWSFPYAGDASGSPGLIASGSIASGVIDSANWKVFGKTGNANANILGYGNYRSTFQYSVDGLTGGGVGPVIPTYGFAPFTPYMQIGVGSGVLTQVEAGHPNFSGGRPFVKTGSGSLVVNESNATRLPFEVSEGTLVLANMLALPNSQISVSDSAAMRISAGVVTSVAGLTIADRGFVDIGNGSLTVESGLTASQVIAQLQRGRGDGQWLGSSGISSSIVAMQLSAGMKRAVGWLTNADGSTTIAYAAPGDGTLDGLVDIMDVAHFLVGGRFDSGTQASWRDGDYNYDGIVDVLDLKDFLGAGLYDAGYYRLPASQSPVSAVPEPSTYAMALVGLACGGYARWKRRKPVPSPKEAFIKISRLASCL
jgi:autotransporter-associated beta strand protein